MDIRVCIRFQLSIFRFFSCNCNLDTHICLRIEFPSSPITGNSIISNLSSMIYSVSSLTMFLAFGLLLLRDGFLCSWFQTVISTCLCSNPCLSSMRLVILETQKSTRLLSLNINQNFHQHRQWGGALIYRCHLGRRVKGGDGIISDRKLMAEKFSERVAHIQMLWQT